MVTALWRTCPPPAVVCTCPLACFPLHRVQADKLALGDLRCHSLESYGLNWLKSIICNAPAVPTPTFTHDLLIASRNHLKIGPLSQRPLLVSPPGHQSNAVMITRSHICLHLCPALHVFICSQISPEHLQCAKDCIGHWGAHWYTIQAQNPAPKNFHLREKQITHE